MKRGAWQKLLLNIFFVGNGVCLFGGQAQVVPAPAMNPFFMGGGYAAPYQGVNLLDPRNVSDPRVAKLMGRYQSIQTLHGARGYFEGRLANLYDNAGMKALIKKGKNGEYDFSYIPDDVLIRLPKKDQNTYRDLWAVIDDVNGNLKSLTVRNLGRDLINELEEKAVESAGKVFEKHLQTTAERTIGSAWDYAVDQMMSLWNGLWFRICCDNQRPFTDKVLAGWQDLVLASFDDVKRMLNEDIRDRSRACDVTQRQTDDQTPDTKLAETQTPGDAGKGINVWKDLIGCYAMQFDYLVTQVDKHKGYYDEQEDSLIVSYAEQIKRQLLLARNLLVSVNSLQGLDAAIGTNKAMIDAMRNSFDTLFKLLRDQVRDDKGSDVVSRQTSSSSRSSKNDFYSGYGSMGSSAREREL